MSSFATPDLTPNPELPRIDADLQEGVDARPPPPGGLLDLADALAEALAAVEAVEAQRTFSVRQAPMQAPELAHDSQEDPPERGQARPPEIRGMPTVSSADARGQLSEQVRDLTLKLADAKHKLDRDQKELEQLLTDLSVTRKRYHKLGTDHDELRKRLQRAELDLPEQGARNVLNALLGPLDHLHEVFGHLAARETLTPEGREAMSMLEHQWQRAFVALQVTPFDVVGQVYDAQLHEYIAQAPSDKPEGQVIKQVGRGYLIGGRLLRSARVVVSGGLNPRQTGPIEETPPLQEAPEADDAADL